MESIDQDLDLHAKKKKLLRLVDEQFLAGQTPDLPKLQLQLRELKVDELELETGRPRTDAYMVYLFLMRYCQKLCFGDGRILVEMID